MTLTKTPNSRLSCSGCPRTTETKMLASHKKHTQSEAKQHTCQTDNGLLAPGTNRLPKHRIKNSLPWLWRGQPPSPPRLPCQIAPVRNVGSGPVGPLLHRHDDHNTITQVAELFNFRCLLLLRLCSHSVCVRLHYCHLAADTRARVFVEFIDFLWRRSYGSFSENIGKVYMWQ